MNRPARLGPRACLPGDMCGRRRPLPKTIRPGRVRKKVTIALDEQWVFIEGWDKVAQRIGGPSQTGKSLSKALLGNVNG
jgi:hypothetical protein